MTKVLTTKCSYPNESGDIKQSICDFNIMHAIQMDIEIFNYAERVFKDYFSGRLRERTRGKNQEATTQRFEIVLKEKIDFIFEPQISTLSGTVPKRINSDAMNNFNIEMVARSFTNIEDLLKQKFENSEYLNQKRVLLELEELSFKWIKDVDGEVEA
mmetsp:Transcript_17381/g.29240  ORF Transcript_17381/g.29240 Transcript_17381/m.29240 type:complete len:157 (+) Transcript_17381:811-1281(+)